MFSSATSKRSCWACAWVSGSSERRFTASNRSTMVSAIPQQRPPEAYFFSAHPDPGGDQGRDVTGVRLISYDLSIAAAIPARLIATGVVGKAVRRLRAEGRRGGTWR